MLLKYSKWRKLNEENSQVQHYFSFNLEKEKPINIIKAAPLALTEAIYPIVKAAFPSAKRQIHSGNGIIIPNDKYENLEGEKEEIILDLTKVAQLFGWEASSMDYLSILKDKAIPEMAKTTVNRIVSDFEIIPKPEFENLSEEEIKRALIQKTKEILEKKTDVSLNIEDLGEEIEALLVQKSMGSLFYSDNDTNVLIKKLVAYRAFQEIAKAIENTPIKKETIDLSQFKDEVSQKTKSFMVDYSKVSDEELEEIKGPLIEHLYFLAKTLRKRGGSLQQIGIDNTVELLQHLEKFPGLQEKLYS